MNKPKVVVFANGEAAPKSGGSGFRELYKATLVGILNAEIVAVVSTHPTGGVFDYACEYGIPFIHLPDIRKATSDDYQWIMKYTGAGFAALSGWINLVRGLNPCTTFNIHPGPLPRFGGHKMYGHRVHEKVLEEHLAGNWPPHSEVSMHFVEDPHNEGDYDKGPIFFRRSVPILPKDTAEDLQKRVNKSEHDSQARITNMVLNGEISWDGVHGDSLKVPPTYYAHLPIGQNGMRCANT